MGSRLKTLKLNDELSKMLSEIADYMGITESDVLRYLIKKEYMRIQKQKVQVTNAWHKAREVKRDVWKKYERTT